MSNKLSRIAEVSANVAIVIVAIILVVTLVKNQFMSGTTRGSNNAPNSPPVAAGTKVTLADVDWAKNNQTLVLVLQKGCHFCTESAPFYQRLVAGLAKRADVRLVAVLPQAVAEGQQYLTELGVQVNEVKQGSMATLGVRGTPTLILVNNEGVVVDSWIGKLQPEKESEVLSRLKI